MAQTNDARESRMDTDMTDRIAVEKAMAPVSAAEERRRERRVRDGFWPKFVRFAARLPFAEDVAAAWYMAMDPKTPLKARGMLFAALAYFIMPLDVVPDLLAFVGLTDDIAVLTIAISTVRGHMRPEHREKARLKIARLQADEVDAGFETHEEEPVIRPV